MSGMVAKGRLGILGALLMVAACTPDDFKGVEIRYMAWGNPQQLALEKQFCEEFSKDHPGIRVKFIQTPSSAYKYKMVLMLASHTAPDVMRVDHYDFPALVAKDYYYPLDDLIKNDPTYKLSDYFSGAMEEGIYKDKQYGLSVLFGSPIIYYNKDLLAKAGLEEPYNLWKRGEWTWDAYLRYARAMSMKDKSGKPTSFGSWISGLVFQAAVAYTFGGSIMEDGKVTFTTGPTRDAMAFLHDLRFKYKAEPNASQSANSMFSFDGGKIGMEVEWMGITPRLRDTAKFDWDVCPMPIKPGGTTLVKGNQLVMSAESKHPEAAWEFMKFMTGKRTEEKLYVDLRRCFPTRKDVAYSPEFLASGNRPPHHLDAFIYSVEKGRVLPITSRWAEWNTEFNSGLEPLFNGTTHDIDGTLAEAQRRANETLAVREGL